MRRQPVGNSRGYRLPARPSRDGTTGASYRRGRGPYPVVMTDAFELEIELATTREQLADLPGDAFNDRITLRDRIIELEAAVAAATPVQRDTLLTELRGLKATRARLVKARMDPSIANGGLGSGGGVDPNFLHTANRKIDAMTGVSDVESRILEIERLLGTGQ